MVNVVQATGKRKTSVARATLKKGNGAILINNEDYKSYINNEVLELKVTEPLVLSGFLGKYDIKINVFGGGSNSQADAMRQAIAKALIEISGKDDLKKTFLEYDRSLIIADTRFKEMKKPNNSHARAKRQKSYR
ncbi:MAG: 30S ribosomal protein S9 [Nanoarchaeota archaeon]|nr:30S ribosomal protein S9 [Nanoarchaeota archaeon]